VKIIGIFMALLTILSFCASEGTAFAMGANGGNLYPQGNTTTIDEGKGQREKKVDMNGEDMTKKEKADEKTGLPSPKKKPRLKYRDMYECGC
jgi:hypothetical protein